MPCSVIFSNAPTVNFRAGGTVLIANGHTVTHNHNSSGLLASVVDATNKTESYGYDSDKNKTSITDRKGQVHQVSRRVRTIAPTSAASSRTLAISNGSTKNRKIDDPMTFPSPNLTERLC